MNEVDVIPAHKDSWSRKDLFKRILSRYCVVLEDIGGRVPTYVVSERQNENMHEQLEEINSHFRKLGFSARLYPDDPWIIQLIPDPKKQWPSPRFVMAMWLLSIFTTVFAGEKWMSTSRPEGGWFVENTSLDAFFGYTLPLFFAIILASYTQKYLAAKRGVNLPHLFPIPGPAIIWWPFGLIGFASLPRSDARLWPDRSSLGNVAISSPLVMIIFGFIFTMLGIYLTPEVVSITAAPLALELPLLINLIGLTNEGELMMILKTSWAHPLTRAGMTLSFLGWVSLLPIPTFPGGRILIARMGIPEARSGSTQVMLLLVVLLFGFLFGAFSSWTIWVPIVALCASLLITKGSDPRLPIILDDFKGLPESDHRRLGIILFMAFMFALPAQVPFVESDNWDDDLSFAFEHDSLDYDDGWYNQTIIVSNPSLIVQDWNISYIGGFNGDIIIQQIDCSSGNSSSDDNTSCVGKIDPLTTIEVEFKIYWNELWNSTSRDIFWLANGVVMTHTINPDSDSYPIGDWIFNNDLDDPEACILVESDGTVNVSQMDNYASWANLDDTNISIDTETPTICVIGLSGDDLSWLNDYDFAVDNHTFRADFSKENVISIPSSGIELTSENLMFSQSILALNHEGNCIDLGTPALPLISEAGVKSWNMSIFPVGINSHEENNTTTILHVPDSSTVSDCQSVEFPTVYSVKRGPSLTIVDKDKKTQHWIGSFTVTNDTISIQNNGDNDVILGIEFDGNGAQWDISNTITLAPGVITDIPAIPPENGVSFTWLELKQGEVILHLVNHEV